MHWQRSEMVRYFAQQTMTNHVILMKWYYHVIFSSVCVHPLSFFGVVFRKQKLKKLFVLTYVRNISHAGWLPKPKVNFNWIQYKLWYDKQGANRKLVAPWIIFYQNLWGGILVEFLYAFRLLVIYFNFSFPGDFCRCICCT